ncbi:phage holin, LLH family [Paenibacillus eucommiae]|uniref:Phage holin n=1 Tax=Paenibacillus eucommiae TaxID=1355755 RepID=A0ABS4IRJ7_9BACL|nr:phage holin, LLH family [Paenibacillus eucommiae]MBP1990192.1 hypothetical protein [Paenibacillus eucommiae]
MELIQPYITGIVQAVIGLLATFLIAGLFAVKKNLEAWVESRTSKEQRELLHKIASEGFALAEQTFKQLGGEQKLSSAQDYVIRRLNAAGIQFTAMEIRAAIEKAVLDYKALRQPNERADNESI